MNKVVTSGVQIILGTILIICAMLPQEKQTIDPTKTKQDLPQKTSIPFAGLIAGAGVFITLKGLGELYFGWVKADDPQEIQQADHQPQYRSPPADSNRQPQVVPPAYQNHQSQPVQSVYQNRQPQPTYYQSQQTDHQSQRVKPASQNHQQPVSPAYQNHQQSGQLAYENHQQPTVQKNQRQQFEPPHHQQPNYHFSQKSSPFDEEDLWDTEANTIEDEPLTFHNLPVQEQSPIVPVDQQFPTAGAGVINRGPVDQTFLDETAGYSYVAAGVPRGEPDQPIILLTEQLKHNILSWVLCGLPGAGKSTLLLAWLAETVKYSKNVQVFINGWKGDDWLGLAAIPGVYKRNYRDRNRQPILDGFFSQLDAVSDILHQRLGLPENQRKNLPKVWLVLDDFFATSNALNKAKKELAEAWESAKAQMGEIITLGREVGVGLCVATQSLNVQTLGCDDANIRGCLGICALGKIYTDAGRKEGGYSPITNALKNTYIIPSEYVGQITTSFNKLRPISERTGYAIALTTFGEPSIGLFTEDLSWVRDYKIPVNVSPPTGSNVVKFPTEPTKSSPITSANFNDELELDEDLDDELEDESTPERFIY